MSVLDWFRTASRQREPDPDLYEEIKRLRVDMRELQRDYEGASESIQLTLRKLAKRQSREGCAGCQEKEEPRADPVSRPITLLEARRMFAGRQGL